MKKNTINNLNQLQKKKKNAYIQSEKTYSFSFYSKRFEGSTI